MCAAYAIAAVVHRNTFTVRPSTGTATCISPANAAVTATEIPARRESDFEGQLKKQATQDGIEEDPAPTTACFRIAHLGGFANGEP